MGGRGSSTLAPRAGDLDRSRRLLLRGGAATLAGGAVGLVSAAPAAAATTVDGGTGAVLGDLIVVRRGTASDWASASALAEGEFGYETDTGGIKVGDGSTSWADLPYFLRTSPSGVTASTPGDLWLAAGAWSAGPDGGVLHGGVIRNATHLHLKQAYVQTVAPEDSAIGTGVIFEWDATLLDGGYGPTAQDGFFGPRGVYGIEGQVRYGADMSSIRLTPIGFGDLLIVRNTPGDARNLTPGWGFMEARGTVADGAVVRLLPNDTARGGASFVDNVQFVGIDGGSFDGTHEDYEHIGFLSVPWFVADGGAGAFRRRIGFDVDDCDRDAANPLNLDYENLELEHPAFPGLEITSLLPTPIEENIGLRIRHLRRGDRNVGILNGSATVESPLGADVADPQDPIPIDATVVELTNTSGAPLVLAATPTIPEGMPGQRLTLVNVSGDPIVLQDESLLAGSAVAARNGSVVVLRPQGVASFVYSGDRWLEAAGDPLVGTNGRWLMRGDATDSGLAYRRDGEGFDRIIAGTVLNGFSVLALGDGTSDVDVGLVRTAPRTASISGGLAGAVLRTPRTVSGNHTLAVVPAMYVDDAGTVVESTAGAAVTVTIPTSATAPFLVGTDIWVRKMGTGDVTIAPAGGVTLRVPASLSATITEQYATVRLHKRAADEWVLSAS